MRRDAERREVRSLTLVLVIVVIAALAGSQPAVPFASGRVERTVISSFAVGESVRATRAAADRHAPRCHAGVFGAPSSPRGLGARSHGLPPVRAPTLA